MTHDHLTNTYPDSEVVPCVQVGGVTSMVDWGAPETFVSSYVCREFRDSSSRHENTGGLLQV